MKLWYLVEIDTNAPPDKREGVGKSLARAVHAEFGADARVAQMDEGPHVSEMTPGRHLTEITHDPSDANPTRIE